MASTSPHPSDPEDDENAALSAFLGFSSFGSQKPPAKKRKFNAATDAFVERQDLDKINRGGKKGKGSGGNQIPLGKQRIIGGGGGEKKENTRMGGGNRDEIDLGDEGEETSPARQIPRRGLTQMSLPPPVSRLDAPSRDSEGIEDEGDADGPQYIDTSEPAPLTAATTQTTAPLIPDSEALEMQQRIDAILHSIGSAPPPPGMDSFPQSTIISGPPPTLPAGLPARPAFSDTASSHGDGRGGFNSGRGGGRGGRERGQHNDRWYDGYYDPSFNENPWAELEKSRGLEAVGTWVERPRR